MIQPFVITAMVREDLMSNNICPECGKKLDGTCECLDYTVKGFCGDCGMHQLIGDFDLGVCNCGSENLIEGLN